MKEVRITPGDLCKEAVKKKKKTERSHWQQCEDVAEKSAEAIVAKKKREGLNLLTTRKF